MISRIAGALSGLSEGIATVDISGICYEILISKHTHRMLTEEKKILPGDELTFHTIHYIESSPAGGNQIPRLIGFLEKSEKIFFEKYISVKGLGIRKALKSMTLPVPMIANAVETEDTRALMALPEIGKRLAAQIIAELKGKVTGFAQIEEAAAAAPSPEALKEEFILEALDILTGQLQYRKSEAENMIRRALTKNPSIDDAESLIREIFIQQGKRSGARFETP
jgi:Holliday junction DNA helicase RuvA